LPFFNHLSLSVPSGVPNFVIFFTSETKIATSYCQGRKCGSLKRLQRGCLLPQGGQRPFAAVCRQNLLEETGCG
jgi:hypothetical protein